jgi:hypothetical protein
MKPPILLTLDAAINLALGLSNAGNVCGGKHLSSRQQPRVSLC